MIHGATQIIGNVPGQYLNPLLVAESQAAEQPGFIVVVYNLEPKQYDLLFLKGRAITHCARMNKDLRFFIDQHAVTTAFRDHHHESLVSLFTCDDENIQRFVQTCHSEPCLKVHVDALSKKQILALIKSTGCTQGIIERNDFSDTLPVIELKEIESLRKLPAFKAGLKHGRLLVYDLLKNREIQSHRFTGESLVHHATRTKKKRTGNKKSNDIEPRFAEETKDIAIPKEPAAAVEALIHEILGTTQVAIDNSQLAISELTPVPSPPSPVDQAGSSNSTISDHHHDQPQPSQREVPSELQPSTQETLPVEKAGQSDFTRALERLLRSFRQQVVELCAQRAESVFAAAEKKALMLNPDFDWRSLDDTSASIVLDLMEEMVRHAPLLKRSRLRDAAAEMVSDLYNKQYELLEQHNAIDAVEQCYYRLKGSKS